MRTYESEFGSLLLTQFRLRHHRQRKRSTDCSGLFWDCVALRFETAGFWDSELRRESISTYQLGGASEPCGARGGPTLFFSHSFAGSP